MRLPIISRILSRITVSRSNNEPTLSEQRSPDLVAMIAVTYQCQCNCHHCCSSFFECNKDKEFTTEEIKDIIRQCADMKCRTIHFFGGEPLMREDIIELIRYTTELGLDTVMDTNGCALDEEMGDKLAEAGMTIVMVSIDGTIPEVHDTQRRFPGLWHKAIRAVEIMRDRGVETRIGTVVDKEKLANGDFAKMLQLADDMGVKVRVFVPIMAGKWGKAEDVLLSDEEIAKMKSMLVPGKFFWEQESCNGPDKQFICNAATKGGLYVTAYGDVTPCSVIPLSFGNVKDEPLADIVERMFKHPMYQKAGCTDCLMNDKQFREECIYKFKTTDKFPVKIDY